MTAGRAQGDSGGAQGGTPSVRYASAARSRISTPIGMASSEMSKCRARRRTSRFVTWMRGYVQQYEWHFMQS